MSDLANLCSSYLALQHTQALQLQQAAAVVASQSPFGISTTTGPLYFQDKELSGWRAFISENTGPALVIFTSSTKSATLIRSPQCAKLKGAVN